jgi:hypothetical protein
MRLGSARMAGAGPGLQNSNGENQQSAQSCNGSSPKRESSATPIDSHADAPKGPVAAEAVYDGKYDAGWSDRARLYEVMSAVARAIDAIDKGRIAEARAALTRSFNVR